MLRYGLIFLKKRGISVKSDISMFKVNFLALLFRISRYGSYTKNS